MTPLHVAAERAHNDIMEVLQKHGAKVQCSPHPSIPSAMLSTGLAACISKSGKFNGKYYIGV